jgi:outer membrane immunogenic protein
MRIITYVLAFALAVASAIGLGFLVPPAEAADVAPRMITKAPTYTDVYSWSGLYVHGFADYGANFGTDQIGTATFGTSPHGPGVGGGLDLLYQLPSSPWVIGLRAEIGYANMSGSANSPVVFNNGSIAALQLSNATNYLGDVNAILGYTITADQKLLGYVTGGLGYVGAKPNLQVGSVAQGVSDTAIGYDVGAGLWYAITQNWSINLEGLYHQTSGKSVTLPIGGVTSDAAYNIFTQKFGVAYRF